MIIQADDVQSCQSVFVRCCLKYHMIKTDNGDFLCYDVMIKSLQ